MVDLAAATDLCRLLGDATRVRLLSALGVEALTVAELVRVTGLGQSRVSTHLARLKEAGLVTVEPQGTSALYALDAMPPAAQQLWALLADQTRDPVLADDRRRVAEVVRARAGETWADQVAGRMARHYSPGRTWASFARGAVGLVRVGDVVDIASGDGALAELLAPRARSVTCVDWSARVTAAGQARLRPLGNVRFVRGDMHRLPLPAARFDAALLLGALCHAESPRQVLAEAARVLRPGGQLVAVTLAAHEHHEAVSRYDHRQPGFEPATLAAWLEAAGFDVELCAPTQRERRPPHFTVITVHARRRP
ncbi:MAG: metalloregulator ArsR/SmtB family transcription factor [Myxococcales bacterium]|nr:metalloregulator ArsR/SmtB family transcription factor [Myxococcales bacterium]